MTQRAAQGAFTGRGHWSYLFYAVTLFAVGASLLSLEALAQLSWAAWLYVLAALGLLFYGTWQRHPGVCAQQWLWVLMSAAMAAIAASGGQLSPFYPLMYLFWVAAPTWVDAKRRLFTLAAGYVGLELALWWSAGSWGWFVEHLVLSGLFLGTHRLVFGGYLRWLRDQQAHSLAEQQRAYAQDAQDFRLGAGAWTPSNVDQEHASVASVHSTIDFELDLLRASIGVHSILLFWPDESSTGAMRWRIKAHRASGVRSDCALDASGFLAPLVKGEGVLRVHGGVQPRHRFYYEDSQTPVQSVCAVAIGEGQPLEGVLLADRLDARPFSEAEVEILQRAGQHLTRCLAQERAFAQVEAQQRVQAQLHAASVHLSQALGMAQLQESSLEALCMLLPNDLALLFVAQNEPGDAASLALVAHRPGAGADPQWQACVDIWAEQPRLQSQAGMVGGVLKNRVKVMPNRPDAAQEGWSIFGGGERLLGAGSVLALPLAHADQCDAVAVFLCCEPLAFDAQDLRSAGILVNQVGAAMQNARLYDQMQRQATTDGLTGLANHRAFQARLEESIAHARRTGQPLSLILTDIDHFKGVNDTHGHPVGDAVLREVAEILQGIARKYDLVARYGGEEFVLLLPGSDQQAALALAERLRVEVQDHVMQTSSGEFGVTLSLGIAQWQDGADTRQALIDRADQALYACKGAGRNCVRRFVDLASQKPGNASVAMQG